MKDNRTDKEIGFTEGLWYAIEQLVLGEQHYIAQDLIEYSNLPEWEFRKALEETQYKVEELSEFLDKVFEKEEIK